MVKDPVCGMEIDEKTAKFKTEKDGKTYYFCSQHCKDAFLSGKMAEGHKHDHSSHHAHMLEDFKKRLVVSLILTVPVLILSKMIQSFFGISIAFPGDNFLLFIFSTFVFFYGGWPFITGLLEELEEKQPGMMTLIGLAITIAYIYSSLVIFGLKGEVFFWELVTLIDIMLLGHFIEMRSVMGASKALEELAKLLPSTAHLISKSGEVKDIKVEELRPGDNVLVKPGEKIPVDGKIISGESEVDEAMITGESKPIDKKKDDSVIGGTINGNGSLTVTVTKTGKDSYISKVIELVRQASESKSKAQEFADRAAFFLTIVAIISGFSSLFAWLLLGRGFIFALERMVTVMVITCPHALGLAIPLVIAVITALSAKNGILVRNRAAFENARKISVVVFDKTGTLTKGEFGVTDIVSFGDWSEDELLRRAASIESNSEHTIAKGIVKKAKEKNLDLYRIENFKALPGKGAKAVVGGVEVLIGNINIVKELGIEMASVEKEINKITSEGKTIVLVASGGKIQGLIGLADIIRDESWQAVKDLKKLGIEVSMITGDNQLTAKFVARELGLDSFFAEVLPDKKSEKIQKLKEQGPHTGGRGKIVAMVGDGINDAPALASADVGIAIGAGTDVAIETADVVLVSNDPRNVVDIIKISQLNYKKMVQNLAWATGYNVIAIPLAAGLLFNYGIMLSPAVGAVVMSLSTVIVAVNARITSYVRSE